MRQIKDTLIVGVGVHGSHQAALNRESIVQHLCHGSQAVGRARGVGNDIVLNRVILIMVYAHYNGNIFALGRCADDDLLSSGIQVQFCLFPASENTG